MGLAPWDEAKFFQPPVATTVFVGSSTVIIAKADPTRVLLTFSNMTASTFAVVTPNQTLGTTGTLFLAGGATIIINYDWWGPLTQVAWYGFSTGGTTIGIQSVSLSGFPQQKGGGLNAQIKALANAIQRLSNYFQPTAVK